MSRYVQRCTECRALLGVSSFRVIRNGGGRSARCKVCESGDHVAEVEAAAIRSELAQLEIARTATKSALMILSRRARSLALQLRAIDGRDDDAGPTQRVAS
jgi:hypothetical protein